MRRDVKESSIINKLFLVRATGKQRQKSIGEDAERFYAENDLFDAFCEFEGPTSAPKPPSKQSFHKMLFGHRQGTATIRRWCASVAADYGGCPAVLDEQVYDNDVSLQQFARILGRSYQEACQLLGLPLYGLYFDGMLPIDPSRFAGFYALYSLDRNEPHRPFRTLAQISEATNGSRTILRFATNTSSTSWAGAVVCDNKMLHIFFEDQSNPGDIITVIADKPSMSGEDIIGVMNSSKPFGFCCRTVFLKYLGRDLSRLQRLAPYNGVAEPPLNPDGKTVAFASLEDAHQYIYGGKDSVITEEQRRNEIPEHVTLRIYTNTDFTKPIGT
jgi:hypothetical protein